jgi:TetR/AcrR family transcriptional repressor of bet genes
VITAEALHQPAVRAVYQDMLLAQIGRIDKLLADVLRSEGRSTRGCRSLAAAIAAAIQGVYQIDAALPGTSETGSSAPALRHMIQGLVAAQPKRSPKRSRPSSSPR